MQHPGTHRGGACRREGCTVEASGRKESHSRPYRCRIGTARATLMIGGYDEPQASGCVAHIKRFPIIHRSAVALCSGLLGRPHKHYPPSKGSLSSPVGCGMQGLAPRVLAVVASVAPSARPPRQRPAWRAASSLPRAIPLLPRGNTHVHACMRAWGHDSAACVRSAQAVLVVNPTFMHSGIRLGQVFLPVGRLVVLPEVGLTP